MLGAPPSLVSDRQTEPEDAEEERVGDRKMILLEGNIAAGKSTVGKVLKASGMFDFIEEPVDEWQGGFASNMLDTFYRDMERWAFAFQMVAFITRPKTWDEIRSLTSHSLVVLERSVFTDRHVFAPMLHGLGAMTDAEWQVYCGLWDCVVSNYCAEPDCIFYLRTPAEFCMERISTRGRDEEGGITLDYLRQLERLHDEWLLRHPRVSTLDGTRWWTADEILEVASDLLEV